jgi:hemoglobin
MATLDSRAELIPMIDRFYDRVKADALIGPIFNDVAKVDWNHHLPKIYDFWDSLLFGANNYRGRPFAPHIRLDLKEEHFQRWLSLFFLTVDEFYVGLKAEEIKDRAYNIGNMFYKNIQRLGADPEPS